MSEVWAFNRELTPEEVREIYELGLGSDLVATHGALQQDEEASDE